MKKRHRLLRRGDFQRLVSRPAIFAGSTIIAFATVDHRPELRPPGVPLRVGVTAARRISGSVVRNQAKRRVREAVRVSLPPGLGGRGMGTPYDVVLIARPSALRVPLDRITADVRSVWERLR